ncbi:GTP-binding protein [Methanofollis aquaemaris]|uniref:GTP-binding protein n=1 Tax=Methanofollis aquaemaris TaxID=126734 RepID=A0A8A3S747_9EURY|nr:GTP-binding protein [Methanofollis aquaemaris]QSZ67763.1 GTP-binding protein [Methanofollis aquaemaris]
MIRTGILAFDRMIGGGVPKGKRALFSLGLGVEGQQFLFSALQSARRQRRRCLVVVPQATRDAFLSGTVGTPYHIEGDAGLYFLDSPVFEEIDASRVATPETEAIVWENRLDTVMREHSIDAVFLYSNRLCDALGTSRALGLFADLCARRGVTLFVEYLNLYGGRHLRDMLASVPFDLVVTAGEGFGNHMFLHNFRVEQISWMDMPPRQLPFVVHEDGRLVPQIPKIVVTGPVDAGKTTFIRTVSKMWVSSDREGVSGTPTTVAMDFGNPSVTCSGFEVNLFGTPGQEHFGPIIRHLLTNATGVVFMVDGSRAGGLEEAHGMLANVLALDVPFLVAVNMKDLSGEIGDAEVREVLGVPQGTPVISFSAKKLDEATAVVDALVGLIVHGQSME